MSTSDPQTPRIRIAVGAAEAAEITVRVDPLSQGDRAPLVLLVAGGSSGPSVMKIEPLRQEPHTGYAIARFRGIPAGEYLVVVEPPAP